MCGRYVTGSDEHSWRDWARLLELSSDAKPSSAEPFIPGQTVDIVRWGEAGPELVPARWGLAPSWMKQPLKGAPQYNVRVETAPTKFKKYYAKRRCVLPASGFWVRREGSGERVFVRVAEHELFGLAGIWTERDLDGQRLRSCTILTRASEGPLAQIHARAPVVVPGAAARAWIDLDQDLEDLAALSQAEVRFELAA